MALPKRRLPDQSGWTPSGGREFDRRKSDRARWNNFDTSATSAAQPLNTARSTLPATTPTSAVPQQQSQYRSNIPGQSTRPDAVNADFSRNVRNARLAGGNVENPFASGVPQVNPITGNAWNNQAEVDQVRQVYDDALSGNITDEEKIAAHAQRQILHKAGQQTDDPDFGKDVGDFFFGPSEGGDAAVRRNRQTGLVGQAHGDTYKGDTSKWDAMAANMLTHKIQEMSVEQVKGATGELLKQGGSDMADHMRNRLKTLLGRSAKGKQALEQMKMEREAKYMYGTEEYRNMDPKDRIIFDNELDRLDQGLPPPGMKDEEMAMIVASIPKAKEGETREIGDVFRAMAEQKRARYGLTEGGYQRPTFEPSVVGTIEQGRPNVEGKPMRGPLAPSAKIDMMSDGAFKLNRDSLASLSPDKMGAAIDDFIAKQGESADPAYIETLNRMREHLGAQTTVTSATDSGGEAVTPETQADPLYAEFIDDRKAKAPPISDIFKPWKGTQITNDIAQWMANDIRKTGKNVKDVVGAIKGLSSKTKNMIINSRDTTRQEEFDAWKKNRGE